jgi:hypothetical protein
MISFEPVKTELWAAGQFFLSDCSASVAHSCLMAGRRRSAKVRWWRSRKDPFERNWPKVQA